MRGVLFVLFALFMALNGLAVQDTLAPTGTIELRTFNADRIAEYQADPKYFYEREVFHEPSLWERLKQLIGQWLEKMLGSKAGGVITSNLHYIIILIGLGLAIWFLSKGGLRHVFHGAPRSLGEVAVVKEDIRGMDLPALIAEAEAQGDLRRAIRLHYLLVLRKLVDQGILKWGPEFTDHDYIQQITDPGTRERFTRTARVFQWVWYGNAEVDPTRYEALRRPFIEFEMAQAA